MTRVWDTSFYNWFLLNECYELFSISSISIEKTQSKLNFGKGNHEYRCGVPKMRTGTNVISSITKFHSTWTIILPIRSRNTNTSCQISFDLLERSISPFACFFFLNTLSLNKKKLWERESRKTGLVGRQSTGLQQRSTEGQEPDWQMQRLCRINTHKERSFIPVKREVRSIMYFCLYYGFLWKNIYI